MIWWLLLWLGRTDGGVAPTPTPDALPFLRRDGRDVGALPTFVRRSN